MQENKHLSGAAPLYLLSQPWWKRGNEEVLLSSPFLFSPSSWAHWCSLWSYWLNICLARPFSLVSASVMGVCVCVGIRGLCSCWGSPPDGCSLFSPRPSVSPVSPQPVYGPPLFHRAHPIWIYVLDTSLTLAVNRAGMIPVSGVAKNASSFYAPKTRY